MIPTGEEKSIPKLNNGGKMQPMKNDLLPSGSSMKIRLLVRGGGFVAAFRIPPFVIPPEVVTWGSRTFALRQSGARVQGVAEYVEVMSYPLVFGATAFETEDDGHDSPAPALLTNQELSAALGRFKTAYAALVLLPRSYDMNADPDGVTLRQGEVFAELDRLIAQVQNESEAQ